MSRKYLQLTRLFTNSFTHLNKQVSSGVNFENSVLKRWAGHSKWQNIKSTKEATDRAKSNTFGKLSRKIIAAVQEGGADMTINSKLKTLWEEAKKVNMPKASFENSVRTGKIETTEKPYWIVCSGPRGIVVGFEVLFSNKKPGHLKSLLGCQIKKINLKLESHYEELCLVKGIIITDPLPSIDNALERAVEDAIDIGIDEVVENEDKALIFECHPERIDMFQQKLESKGYNVLSSSTELDFKELIEVGKEEIEALNTVINKLKDKHVEIIRASYNAVMP